jgi:hypothetical protein
MTRRYEIGKLLVKPGRYKNKRLLVEQAELQIVLSRKTQPDYERSHLCLAIMFFKVSILTGLATQPSMPDA